MTKRDEFLSDKSWDVFLDPATATSQVQLRPDEKKLVEFDYTWNVQKQGYPLSSPKSQVPHGQSLGAGFNSDGSDRYVQSASFELEFPEISARFDTALASIKRAVWFFNIFWIS